MNFLDFAARKLVFEKGIRVDGRKVDELRPLACEVGLLPRTHGSGLFQRGETPSTFHSYFGFPWYGTNLRWYGRRW